MLLSTPEQIEHYRSMGLWSDKRLDQLFVRHVESRPDDLVLVDDQDLHRLTGRRPQCLSFDRAWRRVVGLSSFLTGIGLKPETVIAVMLPPSVDAAILTLVASRMGLILAPIPVTSGEAEIRECLERLNAKAIIACSHYDHEPVAERARSVAAEMFSIRFVFSLGDGAPEGLIELQSMMDDEDSVADEDLMTIPDLPSADAVLAVHQTAASSQSSRWIGRSHNQMLCVARHVCEQTEIEDGDSLMVAHHLTGLVGFAAGMVNGLEAGARLQFHNFVSSAAYASALSEYGVQHVLMPGGTWWDVHDRLSMEVREQLKSITLVWNRSHAVASEQRENETAARLVDLTNFSNIALFCQIRRQPFAIGGVPLGKIAVRLQPEAEWLETHLYGMEEAQARGSAFLGGELCLKGPMIPECAFPEAGALEGVPLHATTDGFIHTEIGCKIVPKEEGEDRELFQPLGDLADVISIGGLTERGADLDALYKSCPGVLDAAAFTAPASKNGPARLMAALVVDHKDGAKDRFFDSLTQKQIASTRCPRDVILVEAIPRQTDGRVKRDSLLAASQVADVA